MNTIDIHEAKTQLSRQAAKGEPFIIAKAGKPLVKVPPLDANWEASTQARLPHRPVLGSRPF